MRVLTIRQPHADLVIAGVKRVENPSRPVPSTLPATIRCVLCNASGTEADMAGRCVRNPSERIPWDYGPHECDPTGGPFPFRLAVHAGQQWEDPWMITASGAYEHPRLGRHVAEYGRAAAGVLLGTVMVTGQHHADDCGYGPLNGAGNYAGAEQWCSRWAEPDRWHIELADPQPLATPVPMRGQPGWWRLPEGVTV